MKWFKKETKKITLEVKCTICEGKGYNLNPYLFVEDGCSGDYTDCEYCKGRGKTLEFKDYRNENNTQKEQLTKDFNKKYGVKKWLRI